MGLRNIRGGNRNQQQAPATTTAAPAAPPGMMKPPPVFTGAPMMMSPMGAPPGMFLPPGPPGMVPPVPVTKAPMMPQLPITTIQPLPGGVMPQMPITTVPGMMPQMPVTTIQPIPPTVKKPIAGGLPVQVPAQKPGIGMIPQQQTYIATTTPLVVSPSGIPQTTPQVILTHPQATSHFIPLGSTISQLPMQCRPFSGGLPFGGGLDTYFQVPLPPDDRPLCPNELSETDFSRLALLSGLDLPTINQLYLEFQQLTHGRGKLDREQYRNIFLRSFYSLAMQNLDRLAEQTFRSYDRDSNGVLDFYDFIAAYKSSTPRIAGGMQQMFNVGLPTSL